jgi:hypothetical protein
MTRRRSARGVTEALTKPITMARVVRADRLAAVPNLSVIRIEVGAASVEVRAGFDPAVLASVLKVLTGGIGTPEGAR